MLNMLRSVINFFEKTFDAISESPFFKTGHFAFRALFGIPLGLTRLGFVDAPIHLLVTAAKWTHTNLIPQVWSIDKKVIDPFYAELSSAANNMTSKLWRGFILGPYLDVASSFKSGAEDWQSQQFGNTKGANDQTINKIAEKGPDSEMAKTLMTKEAEKVNSGQADPRKFFRPISGTPFYSATKSRGS